MNLMITRTKCPTCQKQIEIGFSQSWIWSKITCPRCKTKLEWDVKKKIMLALLIIMILTPVYLFIDITKLQICYQILFPIVFVIFVILSFGSAKLKRIDDQDNIDKSHE